MKKFIHIYLFINVLLIGPLSGQDVPGNEKISYQAIAIDAAGQVMDNAELEIRAAFTSKDGSSSVWYTEIHQVRTNDAGAFQIEIGGSKQSRGALKDVPWGERSVYLSLEMRQQNGTYWLLNRSEMLTVPYAFYANKTKQVEDQEQMNLRNQSIYWNTTGNNESRPIAHFLGNIDNEDLYVKTANETRAIFTKEGQLEIYAGSTINGDQENMDSYPVTIEGSDQGIFIEINENRDNDNNFMAFADDESGIVGAVEGETWDEKTATTEYQIQIALFALQGASLIAKSVAEILVASGESASGGGAAAGAATYVTAGTLIAEAAALLIESINWGVDQAESVGVAYSSGGADYAEYLLRTPLHIDLRPGQVVGIKNGSVSLNTEEADHLRVISAAPIVLGNMPQTEEEYKYEKVAFRGQVPVMVMGEVNIGDYILPSGRNDGLAVAVHPEKMRIADYKRIIGVAWTSSNLSSVSLINVAIGINQNDLAETLDELDKKVRIIMDYLQGEGTLDALDHLTEAGNVAQRNEENDYNPATVLNHKITDKEFDTFLDEHAADIQHVYAQARKVLADRGYDLSQYPEIAAQLEQPIPFMKKIRRDPRFLQQWSNVDRYITEAINRKN